VQKGELKLTSGPFISRLGYSGGGDGDEAGDSCSDVSGAAVGEGLEGSGDVSVDGFSFNEDGTCINESKESLA
jgi:hypothetical protein